MTRQAGGLGSVALTVTHLLVMKPEQDEDPLYKKLLMAPNGWNIPCLSHGSH
jgi:hypothetical protein